MKFSLLIPTRNRLELLKYALESIIKQDYEDWEIIVSDNASIEDIQGYISSLREPRIKYSRSEEFLSITENWNRCVNLCSGDYIIMIGDDDILLKNYFRIAHTLIDRYDSPELIYTNAFLYSYPGVIPNFPNGAFQSFGSLHGMPKKESPFWLDDFHRRFVIQETLNFNATYGTNMQHALISRTLLKKVQKNGKLFYSPYPDIYAMSALFLEATGILIYPKELVVIGISNKSHGYYATNKKDKDAIDFLNSKNEMNEISTLGKVLLPGFIVYTFWLAAIEFFKIHFHLEKLGLTLDYKIYRRRQIKYVLNINDKKNYWSQVIGLFKSLTYSELFLIAIPYFLYVFAKKVFFFLEKFLPLFFSRFCRRLIKSLKPTPSTSYTSLNPPPGHLTGTASNKFSSILEIYDQVEPIDCSKSE